MVEGGQFGGGWAVQDHALEVGDHAGSLRAWVTSPAGRPPPGTPARRVAETPTWLRHEDAPAPCDRTHQTTCADPAGDVTQALGSVEPEEERVRR
ncbi:hypothetical protein F3K43_28385 [Streptomyces sp. LBUM 1476]|nr:hypothetical protein [Streptomyces sp. LBUM 1476]